MKTLELLLCRQVKATLLQLNALEAAMEERLNVPSAPCLSCADWFLPAASTRDRLASSSPVLSRLAGAIRGSPSGHRGRSLFGEKSRKSSPQRSLSDSGTEGPVDARSGSSAALGLSPHSTPDSERRIGGRRDSLGSDGSGGSAGLFKMPRMKHPNPFYLGSLKKTLTDRETEETYNTIKLTSGAENTLFHYVLMETVQGIFIAPTHREVAQLSGSIHPQLIRNFHHCCLSIRAAFQQSLPARGCRAADRSQRSGWGLGPVKEHGVLFQCKPENWTDQRKPAPTMTYWVIGRMLLEPVPQEFYVCFHDSVPEVPVEMAFRLSFDKQWSMTEAVSAPSRIVARGTPVLEQEYFLKLVHPVTPQFTGATGGGGGGAGTGVGTPAGKEMAIPRAESLDSSISFFNSPLSSSSPFSRASSHRSSSSTGLPSMESESMSGRGDAAMYGGLIVIIIFVFIVHIVIEDHQR
ncbi:hypothetical protein CCH79_00012845 [Gambusia affinis]|uniref:CCZ1/INTU/HPS4 third Longin domain-containing protein n=1 Tax=Gambusia affinis TaxID=33528 RepID=A0A315W108_GAMAF|nr:hypothetical protein CCH79_00012845 [Gambusia affinis]